MSFTDNKLRKNPVSRPTQNLRNRVFGNIFDCNEGFSKKPGFSPPHIHLRSSISGENATKVAILDRMLNTRIVHLSAHGLIDDFQSSGIPGAIILAPSGDDDGAIHAVDILQLKLDSELVVLSACSTGRGKITGDGVIGLSRCFILAGGEEGPGG